MSVSLYPNVYSEALRWYAAGDATLEDLQEAAAIRRRQISEGPRNGRFRTEEGGLVLSCDHKHVALIPDWHQFIMDDGYRGRLLSQMCYVFACSQVCDCKTDVPSEATGKQIDLAKDAPVPGLEAHPIDERRDG